MLFGAFWKHTGIDTVMEMWWLLHLFLFIIILLGTQWLVSTLQENITHRKWFYKVYPFSVCRIILCPQRTLMHLDGPFLPPRLPSPVATSTLLHMLFSVYSFFSLRDRKDVWCYLCCLNMWYLDPLYIALYFLQLLGCRLFNCHLCRRNIEGKGDTLLWVISKVSLFLVKNDCSDSRVSYLISEWVGFCSLSSLGWRSWRW